MKIENIMTKNVITASYNNSIYDIANMMLKYDIGCIPIEKNNKIIGIITDRDIVVKAICNKAVGSEAILQYISNNTYSIDKKEDIENALSIMASKRVKRLLVSNNNKLIGIISLSDIVNNCDNELLIETYKEIFKINQNIQRQNVNINQYNL